LSKAVALRPPDPIEPPGATQPALPVVSFPTPKAWDAWLVKHHASSGGVWLKMAKKASGIDSVTYVEAVEVALCHGWIDGQGNPLDDTYWLQRFTPRRSASKWSRINRERAQALMATGRMKPAGLRQVEQAKADGRWDRAYEPPSTASVPDDFAQALQKSKKARDFFSTLDRANRYAILYRINDAKRPETRARRIAQYVAMLAEHKKLH
jgi:uncharacterized protein YdeI (YjbR/CyaY-like superfamily)